MIVIFTGNSASGKSTAASKFLTQLRQKGIPNIFDSDRIRLEKLARKDIEDLSADLEGNFVGRRFKVIGKKSILPKKIVFQILTARVLNVVHNKMIHDLKKDQHKKEVRVIEYATGPIATFPDGTVLRQDMHYLFELLRRNNLHQDVLVREIDAKLLIRSERNSLRPDGLDEATFALLFGDGGEGSLEMAGNYGIHQYIAIDNNHKDGDRFLTSMLHSIDEQFFQEFGFRLEGIHMGSQREREM